MILPTSRSRFAQPSRRLPMPGAKELSTVAWQMAHVMPMEVISPLWSKKPLTPTTALSRSKASVTAGSFRSTLPALILFCRSRGKAAASTFRPTARAVLGLTPGPTPPFCAPAIALWSWSSSPQKASSPKVSKRKIRLPCSIICCAET
jgi:hypothetical protein